MALIDKLTAIADAIRGKTGKTEEMTLDQMATEIAAIETGGGGEDLIAAHFNRTIEHYSSNEVKSVPDYAFEWNSTVQSVDFPSATKVGTSAFWHATKLNSMNIPSATTLGQGAFRSTAITHADFPLATSIGISAFTLCRQLVYVNIPKATSLLTSAFNGCKSLTSIDLPAVTTLDDQVFRGCTSLTTVILRSASVVTMKYTSVFQETPFASGGTGGTVYVPSALIESYKAATNWSALYAAGSCNFVAIEGSEYE